MQLYFIRHAQSENNLLFDLYGNEAHRKPDPTITDTGWKQAKILSEFVRNSGNGSPEGETDPINRSGFHFSHIYCSLMIRSIQTGTVLANATGLPLVALSDLHEGGGIFCKDEVSGENLPLPGNDLPYFKENFPHLILPKDMNDNGWWNRPFEDHQQRSLRAVRLLKLLLETHGNSNYKIALISHGGFYNYFLGEILGCYSQLESGEIIRRPQVWLTMFNTAITRIDWEDEETRLVYHNRIDFMPTELIS